ncbi:hypothetical protein [Amycolatopsis saalfeldensis]|uniref:Uncharacterized protein n=1 Tax=Amycolatopsis saalfeldensis TaxID=394193 RepID=A0A1H8YHZ5_9PSEU|nr:hypothetical protein [Amycolatopsis saalfeldensis]SEP51789.1 hypothetical protein SAMN04489732_117107 [Amycolatopsis saalfeldensis]
MVRALLTAAVEENATWCDVYCRVYGVQGVFGPRAWTSPSRTPELYPDAVTLTPSATAADVLPLVDASAGCSVKDSFASLSLPGFTLLFEASWLHFPVPAAASGWTAAPSPDPSFVFLTGPGSSAVAHRGPSAAGLSNFSGDDWRGAVAAVSAAFPGLPVVGYEHGAALSAALAYGAEPLGVLRVWLRDLQK